MSAIVLRMCGDGRKFQLRLATDARYRGVAVSYSAGFDTIASEWTDVSLPLATFTPTVRGSILSGPPLETSQIREISLLIADKREGPFALDVEWIGAE